jgi:hypothetical protein
MLAARELMMSMDGATRRLDVFHFWDWPRGVLGHLDRG